ncbi:MAG TPA: hypothetical protein VEL74_09840 [Thermoanaerobaculia bacterium]|nr:hypothetical protein [Thermoanaerobaculia bacterium]
MKKAFVHATLCALAMAVPAAASERVFVPALGTLSEDGSALATKVWVTDAEGKGMLRPAAAREEAGLIALEADETQDVSAWMVGGAKVAAEVPVFTDREAYSAGVDVLLADLPSPKSMTRLFVGAANLSDHVASCVATLYRPNGNLLAEIPFEVAPESFTHEDAFTRTGKARVGEVRVTCDQTFYPVGAATENDKPQVVFAKAFGPNGPCNYNVMLTRQPATGFYTAASQAGTFHDATRNNPKGIICVKVPQELRLAKAIFEWDVKVGPWSSKNKAGMHNVAYYFLERYRSGVVGNINAAGGKKRLVKFMQNVGMPRKQNTNAKAGYELKEGLTYHFTYVFDAANKTATLQVFLNGTEVTRMFKDVKPGGQQLVLKPYAKEGLAMVAEFGNFNNQHDPEVPSWGWDFANWKMTAIPK